jgi:hypothetical protein
MPAKGGLRISPESHQALTEIRQAVEAITEHDLSPEALVTARTHVWNCRNRLRAASRADIVFLFKECRFPAKHASNAYS